MKTTCQKLLKRGGWYASSLLMLILHFSSQGESSSFNDSFDISWGNDHVKLLNNGETVELSLDKASGSGFTSKYKYLVGNFNMKIKLIAGNSAGTVTAYYMSSDSTSHDEIDFEFLGNLPGKGYHLQTNIFVNGSGNREQRIRLWFNPSTDFHNYSILWNQKQIIFGVDAIPIRAFRNDESLGFPYPQNRPMKIISTIWNGEDWATNGGKAKIDWSKAPFIASFQAFEVDGCVESTSSSPSPSPSPCVGHWWEQPDFEGLNQDQLKKLKWVQENYMFYDYCKDNSGRFSSVPIECAINP